MAIDSTLNKIPFFLLFCVVLGNIAVTFIFLCSVLLMITLIDGTSSREKDVFSFLINGI